MKLRSPWGSRRSVGRPRDSQRQKVYDVERAFWAGAGVPLPELSKDEVLGYVHLIAFQLGLPMPEVRWGRRGQNTAFGGITDTGHPQIVLPPGMRSEHWMAHELAHAWLEAESPETYAWHGPEWVRCYLLIVEHFFGSTIYAGLLQAFDNAGVRHGLDDGVASSVAA